MKMIINWFEKQWASFQRGREVSRRGWGSIGNMYAYGKTWDRARWGREIRRSNRLYRLARTGNAWKPYKGF